MKILSYTRAMVIAAILLCSFSGRATDRYVSTTGTDDPGGGTSSAPWRTIQYATTNSLAGDVIHIEAGKYIESNILVDKELTLQGVITDWNAVTIVPAAEDGNVDNAFDNNAQNGIVVSADNVHIQYLTIDGWGNPLLTYHKNNFRAGIVTLDPSQAGGGVWNNLHVDNVFIKHPWRRGISVFPRSVQGTLIESSRVDSVAYNQGMYLAGQSQAINNTIVHCFQGIVQNPDGSTPSGLIKATGNAFLSIGNFPGCWGDQGGGIYHGQPRGLQFNNTNSPPRPVEYITNTFTNFGENGVGIYTVKANEASMVRDNTVNFNSNGSQGILVGWSYENGFMVRDNNVNVTGTARGIVVFGSGTGQYPMKLENNVITGTGSSYLNPGDGTGIVISDKYLNGPDQSPSNVLIQKNNRISGFTRGIDVISLALGTPPNLIVSIFSNEIFDNTQFGLNNSTGNPVFAINVWWGSCTGPYHPVYNSQGTGNPVSDMVYFNPWIIYPALAGNITGPPVAYQGQTGVPYSVPEIDYATGYTWSLPPGASIVSGANTNNITVSFSLTASSGAISVYGSNECGNGTPSSINVEVQAPLPAGLSLEDITIENGQSTCYNATQTIWVAGNNTTFEVKPGGNVTMIAGQNIFYLPGTKVYLGGYMRGFITTDNAYCGQQPDSMISSDTEDDENTLVTEARSDFFSVYPNPTRGKFTVELDAGEETADAVVRVYSMMGKLIFERGMTILLRKDFSLENNPNGIYFIKVMKGDQVGTVKLILQH